MIFILIGIVLGAIFWKAWMTWLEHDGYDADEPWDFGQH